jgi:hypothetical protein
MIHFLRYGLAAGIGNVLLYLLLFWTYPRGLFHPALYWGTTAWVVVCVLLAQQAERKQRDPYPFRLALRTGFGLFALATLLFTGFYYVLLNGIDPGLIDLQEQVMRARLNNWAERQGRPSSALPEGYEKESLVFTPARALFSLAQNLIGGFVLAAGCAYLMKRD